jgi:hypothetical protein
MFTTRAGSSRTYLNVQNLHLLKIRAGLRAAFTEELFYYVDKYEDMVLNASVSYDVET